MASRGGKKVYWLTELQDECQLCKRPFMSMMFDCSLAPGNLGGVWANICRNCFLERGCRLGLGYGQQYQRQEDGRWLKVGG